MASPIFASNPNPSFSIIALLKGAQFAVLGVYRLSQDQFIYENSKYFKFTLITIMISILVQATLSIPNLLIRLSCFALETLFHKEAEYYPLIQKINFIQAELLHLPQIVLLLIYSHYIGTFEEIFLNGLQFIDRVSIARKSASSRANYSTWLLKTSKIDLDNRSSLSIKVSQYINLSTSQLNYLSPLLKSYAKLAATNIVLYALYTLAPSALSRFLISFFVARTFNPMTGAWNSFLIFLMGLFVPPSCCIKVYSNFIFVRITVRSLLVVPYFERLKLNEIQMDNWIESRIGLTIGYGTLFHVLAFRFQYISFFLVLLEQMGLAYFIYKASDPYPEVMTDTWILTQIYWTKIYKRLTCHSDGFKPLPGSYILTSKYSPSPSTSTFSTPLPSTTNLKDFKYS